ncbi:MAG: flagellar motor protein [Spirochaetales bacterium]|nr:flagellar motor protein [Spirochaetales bacterium]
MKAGKGMDISTVVGLILGMGGIVTGYIIEGGNPASLLGLSAFIIIFAGVSGALIVSFGIKDFLRIGAILSESFTPANEANAELAGQIVDLSDKARKEGLLSLDDMVDDIEDPLFRKGIRMVVDGVDPDEIEKILDTDMTIYEAKKKEDAEVYAQAGGFAPTMGIIGTVTGLVLVLGNLAGDVEHLGHAIAAAFIATLYGISLANIFALPVANKLKGKIKKEKLRMEMILAGVFAIHKGESPMLVKEKMMSYLEEAEQKLLDKGGSED